MRRRGFTVALAVVGLVLSAQTGNASLETSCYIEGGYFDSGYFESSYFDETCGGAGDPPGVVSGGNTFKNLFNFPGLWR